MFSSIVVGTDGSDSATRAVREALEIARAADCRLDVVTAYAEQRQFSGVRRVPAAPARASMTARQEAEQALADAIELAREAGIAIDAHARRGEPAEVILDLAEQRGADLIVVGNVGMTGAARFLLGSVPNKVSHGARCSVLIARTR